jgi:hypothetical protein
MKGYDNSRMLRSSSKGTNSSTGHNKGKIVSQSRKDDPSSSDQSGGNDFESSNFSMMPDESDVSIEHTVTGASTARRDKSRGNKPGAPSFGSGAASHDEESQAMEKSWGHHTEASSDFCSDHEGVAATTDDTKDSNAMDDSFPRGQRISYLESVTPSKGLAVILALLFALILVLPIAISKKAR